MTEVNTLPSEDGLLFLPLGGSGEIGMNLNLYGYNEKWLMIDLGVTFKEKFGVHVVAPDTSFIEKHKENLLGIVITHAHEDHVGAVPYLWSRLKCPIYATPFTMEILKNKMTEAGLMREVDLRLVPLSGSVKIGDFGIEFINQTHSILEPSALAIRTPLGTVLHTGDWKLDPEPLVGEKTDHEKFKLIGDEGVLAVVCDSTNVFEEGTSGSEGEVKTELLDLVKKQQNKVVVTCFASNIARLVTCAQIAEETGRFVVFLGRSMGTMLEAATKTGYVKPIPNMISVEKAEGLPRDQVMYVCTGSQGEHRAALSRIASKKFKGVNLYEGDCVIFSSRVIPGNEERISDMKNDFAKMGVEIFTHRHGTIHVSGHPYRDELRQMYKWLQPKIAVPVHGEHRHLREHARLAFEECGVQHTIVPENGDLILLAPGTPQVVDRVQSGYLAKDGHQMINFYGGIIRERRRLSEQGVVIVSLGKKVQVEMLGVSELGEEKDSLIKELVEKISDHLDAIASDKSVDKEDEVRLVVKRTINRIRGIKPLVVVHI